MSIWISDAKIQVLNCKISFREKTVCLCQKLEKIFLTRESISISEQKEKAPFTRENSISFIEKIAQFEIYDETKLKELELLYRLYVIMIR